LNPIEQLLRAPLSAPIFIVKCVIADNPAPCCQVKIKRSNRSLPKSKPGKVWGEFGKESQLWRRAERHCYSNSRGTLDRAQRKMEEMKRKNYWDKKNYIKLAL